MRWSRLRWRGTSIWTFDAKGEMLLTALSSLSQEESRSISENVKWGQRKKLSDGKCSLCYGRFLGYEKGEDGTMVINKAQAKVVGRIYGLFIADLSPKANAKRLTEEGAPTPGGQEKWYEGKVRSILKNEKYKGRAGRQHDGPRQGPDHLHPDLRDGDRDIKAGGKALCFFGGRVLFLF